MAHNIGRKLAEEADHKHLTGEQRERYIGGAWDRIKTGEQRREAFHASDDYKALQALGLPIREIRYPKVPATGTGRRSTLQHRGKVVHFRSGTSWYELPDHEYRRLVREGKRAERDKRRDAADYERGRRIYERELARIEREEERERKRAEHAARATARQHRQEDRLYMRLKRAEHSEVLRTIRDMGGVTRGITRATGREVERGEYNELPAHVRHSRLSKRAGAPADVIAQRLHEDMPWLFGEGTGRELYDYFEGHNVRRMHGHAA